jgi:pimeloyl-ACP methyl ester carboxylesterase
MDSQRGLADVIGTRLYHEVAGTGTDVVFVHGLGADLRIWDAQFEVFTEQYHVLRYDVRGHGKSTVPTNEPYAHADDLKALLNFCGMNRAHIIGQSMGGEIALNFALAYPESALSLVLVDSALGGYQWSQEWNASWMPIFTAAAAKDKAGILELVLKHPLLAFTMENLDVKGRLTQILSEYSAWHFLNADPVQQPEPLAAQRLGQIKTPTLIIVGEYELPDYHTIAAKLEEIPGSAKVELSGYGHVIPMEAPDRFNDIVLNFLR